MRLLYIAEIKTHKMRQTNFKEGSLSMSMRIKMLILACGATIVAVLFYFLNVPDYRLTIFMVAAITAYHLAIRVVVGSAFGAARSDINYENAWFKPKRWEAKFYDLIHVHGWKNLFPSYAPEKFDIKSGIGNVIRETCKAEIAHFVLIFLSFAPMGVAFAIGCSKFDIIIFAATGLIASFVDLLFLFVMRYNRPRLISALNYHNK